MKRLVTKQQILDVLRCRKEHRKDIEWNAQTPRYEMKKTDLSLSPWETFIEVTRFEKDKESYEVTIISQGYDAEYYQRYVVDTYYKFLIYPDDKTIKIIAYPFGDARFLRSYPIPGIAVIHDGDAGCIIEVMPKTSEGYEEFMKFQEVLNFAKGTKIAEDCCYFMRDLIEELSTSSSDTKDMIQVKNSSKEE